jgi:hypothetical protein
MVKPYSMHDGANLSMEYWYGEIQKLRGFGCNSSPGGEGVLRGTFVQRYFFSCASRCYHTICMEGFGIRTCWHDQDLDFKDTGHDEGYARYGELRRGFALDE